ncbi:MAG: DNA glycosylase [Candidatus Helarchaeota archaeon]
MNKLDNDKFHEILFDWYKKNKRRYPWRETDNPYHILIAEIMLQRTKADQVVQKYLKFIEKYPKISNLKDVKHEDIEIFFKNLGLYWKIEKIIKMSKYINENLNGKIPNNQKSLLKIPGVGDYIANAILCLAFKKDVSLIDSNIVRFINRFYGIKFKNEGRRDKKIIDKANDILCKKNPKEYNLALLDFTALVCKPKNPKCDICPLNKYCRFFINKSEIK